MPVVTVPRGIQDLTAEWLTMALAEITGGAVATDLVAVRVGNGNVADSVRLVPTWDRPTPGLASLVAKVPSSSDDSRAAGFSTRTYEVEAAFYNELADTLRVNRPRCYLARYAPEDQAYVILMQDLAPAEAGDQVAGCQPNDAIAVMAELAALHAPRWGDETLLDIPWLDRPDPATVRGTLDVVPILYAGFVERYRDRVEPEVLELSRAIMDRLEPYLLNRPQPWSVVHGDFRLDNLLFGGARVVVLDWQTVKIGPPLSDVAYFIGSALHPEARRQHEEDLVRTYHRQLNEADIELTWADCWDAYRRYAPDGLLMGIAASMLVTQTDRSDDMFMAMVNRHGRQALDVGSLELIGD
jgi:hypothetical protein